METAYYMVYAPLQRTGDDGSLPCLGRVGGGGRGRSMAVPASAWVHFIPFPFLSLFVR